MVVEHEDPQPCAAVRFVTQVASGLGDQYPSRLRYRDFHLDDQTEHAAWRRT